MTAAHTPVGHSGAEPLGTELERSVLAFAINVVHHFYACAAKFDLTTQQGHALLLSDQPTAMGDLAEAMRCDTSNVTGIVDRLEARGLMERQVSPTDRRVKLLVLTKDGRDVRRRFETALFAGMPGVDRLDIRAQQDLLALLGQMQSDRDADAVRSGSA